MSGSAALARQLRVNACLCTYSFTKKTFLCILAVIGKALFHRNIFRPRYNALAFLVFEKALKIPKSETRSNPLIVYNVS